MERILLLLAPVFGGVFIGACLWEKRQRNSFRLSQAFAMASVGAFCVLMLFVICYGVWQKISAG